MAQHSLPSNIEPMLATSGEPFDSDQFQFEVKWDGFRALARIETAVGKKSPQAKLISRRGLDMTAWFPELECLSRLPEGCIVDGELVALDENGKPNFARMLSRKQTRPKRLTDNLARTMPVSYVVFDVLFRRFESVMKQPLAKRIDVLTELMGHIDESHVLQSEPVEQQGIAFFQAAIQQGLEGVVAKRLNSKYFPGKRTEAWVKFKRKEDLLCAIIGYMPKENDDFESLIIAADHEGELRCVGRVGTGFSQKMRTDLLNQLRALAIDKPIIGCAYRGSWVSPELFCKVRFTERTAKGDLRDPVFLELVQ